MGIVLIFCISIEHTIISIYFATRKFINFESIQRISDIILSTQPLYYFYPSAWADQAIWQEFTHISYIRMISLRYHYKMFYVATYVAPCEGLSACAYYSILL